MLIPTNLKVPFIKLTQHSSGNEVWINMARCQEMWGHTPGDPYTELIMNIALDEEPYAIQVTETCEEIIAMLAGAQEAHLNG